MIFHDYIEKRKDAAQVKEAMRKAARGDTNAEREEPK